MYSGTQGVITRLNYGNDETIQWNLNTDCDQVHIVSTQFAIEPDFDIVTIDNVPYSGKVGNSTMGSITGTGFLTVVDQVVPGQSVVLFSSDGTITDSGFVLEWQCLPRKYYYMFFHTQ